MKHVSVALSLIILISSSSAHAQTSSQQKTIKEIVTTFAEAYSAKSLGRLDADHPYAAKVKIIIEHSISEDADNNGYAVKRFATLKNAEQWLKSREREDGSPFRAVKPLVQCTSGLCTYDFDGGILHNHLYLKKISYGYLNKRPFIKTIYLYDGD
jgi:hypothetical protein